MVCPIVKMFALSVKYFGNTKWILPQKIYDQRMS